MQFIDFYITANNLKTASAIEKVLAKMAEYGDVKNWKNRTEEGADAVHYSVLGSWAAYSTISSITQKKGKGPLSQDSISFSIEHFEED